MTSSDIGPIKRLGSDFEALKALAHPIRVRILDALSTYGPATASGVGDRIGESSGSTSYHLRQLAKHDFVREIADRGTARERWWERTPGQIQLSSTDVATSPTALAASKLLLNELTTQREATLRNYIDHADELPPQWGHAGTVSLMGVWLTPEQMIDLQGKLEAFMDDEVAQFRDQRVPGARPSQLQINLFPIVDGEQIPFEEPK